MRNPKIPALHFNTRFIVTSKEWFGGGMDATPSHNDNHEKKIIHENLKKICLQNKKNYKKYKKWCDQYFYLPHRKEPRGIGGIFFDYEQKDWIKNFKFVRELGLTFIDISNKIINRKKKLNWAKKDKDKQLIKRGRYVEFNLLYDRGTRFGLNSGGNIDSILMSLPPEAKWK
jgi:coproporphyrinogen III oxidase